MLLCNLRQGAVQHTQQQNKLYLHYERTYFLGSFSKEIHVFSGHFTVAMICYASPSVFLQ
jgi:hypothetical protein